MPPRPTHRILIVEDEDLLRLVLAAMAEPYAEVFVAATAGEALAVLAKNEVDVVLSDTQLGPGPSGIWLLAEVAKRWPATRRHLMSATAQVSPDPFLLKPIEADDLLRVLGVIRGPAV